MRSGERRSNAGSILGEDGGRRSVLGEEAGRRSVLGGEENRRSLLGGGGGEEGRRSRLSEESRRSLAGDVGGGGRESLEAGGRQDVGGDAAGRQILDAGGRRQSSSVALDDGKRIAAAPPIPQQERSRGRGEDRRMEVKQGQRRVEVRVDANEVKFEKKRGMNERKVEERASTYLHWEETPSLPSPPATPPADGESTTSLRFFWVMPKTSGTPVTHLN